MNHLLHFIEREQHAPFVKILAIVRMSYECIRNVRSGHCFINCALKTENLGHPIPCDRCVCSMRE